MFVLCGLAGYVCSLGGLLHLGDLATFQDSLSNNIIHVVEVWCTKVFESANRS